MGASQRNKGQAAERELAKLLTEELGQVVQRRLGQERDGGCDLVVGRPDPDGWAPDLKTWIAIQAKRQERASIAAWMQQARDDAPEGQLPAVAWRPSRRGWVVVMDLEDWCELVREAL